MFFELKGLRFWVGHPDFGVRLEKNSYAWTRFWSVGAGELGYGGLDPLKQGLFQGEPPAFYWGIVFGPLRDQRHLVHGRLVCPTGRVRR